MIECAGMTKAQIDEVLKRVRGWPKQRQQDAARMLELMEEQNKLSYHLTDEQVKEVRRRQRDFKRGKERYATDREMTALWKKFGL